jgi:uncharacterized membrane protein YfcA
MRDFFDLLRESVIVQAILTVGIWAVISYLYIKSLPIPDGLMFAGTTVLGYYFGSKTQNIINKRG